MRHIVITGSHGVGKSTLAQSLLAAIQPRHSVGLVRETARQLVERGFEVNDKMSEDGFIAYITLYLQSFRETKAELVISDRSLFDLYLYTHKLLDRFRSLYLDMLHELVFAEAAQVELYVYVPIEFDMTLDSIRPADRTYQFEIDREVRKLLQYFAVNTVTVRGSLPDRTSRVLEHLYG